MKIPGGREIRVKVIPRSISGRTFGVIKLSKEEIEDEW